MSQDRKVFICIQKMLDEEIIEIKDMRYESLDYIYKKYKNWYRKENHLLSCYNFKSAQVIERILILLNLNYIEFYEITRISYEKYLELVIDVIERNGVKKPEVDLSKYIRIDSAFKILIIFIMWTLILKYSAYIEPEFFQWLLILPGIFITKKLWESINK